MPPRNRRRNPEEFFELPETWGFTTPTRGTGNLTVSDGVPLMNVAMPTSDNRPIETIRHPGMDFWEDPDPFGMAERPVEAIDTSSLDELERLFMESQRRSRRLPPLPDSAPQVNIKRHLSKSERDSRHKPAKDVKKIVAISLDDLVSI